MQANARPGSRWFVLGRPLNHGYIHVVAVADEAVRHRSQEAIAPLGSHRLADDDPRHVAGAGEGEDLLAHLLADDPRGLCAQPLRQAKHLRHPFLIGGTLTDAARLFHMEHDPLRLNARGGPSRRAHDLRRIGARADADQDPFRDRPHPGDPLVPFVGLHLRVDALRRPPQRELAQCDEVPLAEEPPQSPLGLRGDIDLAVPQPLLQIVRGEIDEFDLVRLDDDPVGHDLPDDHPRDAGDDVVEAVEVLNVDGGVDVDAGRENLLDVLPALGVPGPRGVRVGQFIEEEERRLAREGAVQVEITQHGAAVGEFP